MQDSYSKGYANGQRAYKREKERIIWGKGQEWLWAYAVEWGNRQDNRIVVATRQGRDGIGYRMGYWDSITALIKRDFMGSD